MQMDTANTQVVLIQLNVMIDDSIQPIAQAIVLPITLYIITVMTQHETVKVISTQTKSVFLWYKRQHTQGNSIQLKLH